MEQKREQIEVVPTLVETTWPLVAGSCHPSSGQDLSSWIPQAKLNHVMILYIATRETLPEENERRFPVERVEFAAFVKSVLRGVTMPALNSVLVKWASNIECNESNHALAGVYCYMIIYPLVRMRDL
jgi:hypothetical protein